MAKIPREYLFIAILGLILSAATVASTVNYSQGDVSIQGLMDSCALFLKDYRTTPLDEQPEEALDPEFGRENSTEPVEAPCPIDSWKEESDEDWNTDDEQSLLKNSSEENKENETYGNDAENESMEADMAEVI
ncbi:MAG: hypothetical protein WC180_02355 [Candidatus Paceibacterota bacterium]